MGDVCVRGRPGVGRNTLAHRGTARNRLALDIALYVCTRVCTCIANMRLHRYTGETRCYLMRRASACAVSTEFQSSPVGAARLFSAVEAPFQNLEKNSR